MENNQQQLSKKELLRNEKAAKKAVENERIRIHKKLLAYQKKHKKERKVAPKEAFVSLKHVNKIYDNHVQAVYDFNLDIKKHEFIVFVGPSGCGKSTTLRMIAGLESITSGDLFIDGVYSNDLESKDRDISMVFQSYALYPHLSVAGNMAFGLKIRKVPTLQLDANGEPIKKINKGLIRDAKRELYNLKQYLNECDPSEAKNVMKDIEEAEAKVEYYQNNPVPYYVNKHIPRDEITKRVEDAMEILQISEYKDRKPKALSGGQCQRVALGRSIVRKAKVFLMDEPLSNLDAKLRVQMRSEIVKLHKRLNATTVYVTHDQTEAMTMASRIVVMSRGVIQQIGTPIEIYNHPANLFVATFIGSPSMNLYDGTFKDGQFKFEDKKLMPLNEEFSKNVTKFYKNEYKAVVDEKETLLSNFVERNELLAKIDVLEKKENRTEKENNQLASYRSELEAVVKGNERLTFLEEAIEKYEQFNASKEYEVVFGIRPEDIYMKGNKAASEPSKPIKAVITVSELLGHEYFVHIDFANKDLVSKISSKVIIDAGEEIEIVFDLQMAHLFDKVSGKLIK